MPTVTITISLADAAYLPMFLHNAADRTLNIADSLAETDTDMAADLRAEVSHLDRLADAISEATHAFVTREAPPPTESRPCATPTEPYRPRN